MHTRVYLYLAFTLFSSVASANAQPRGRPPTTPTNKLTISLDVPAEKAPGWVCVVTRHRSCQPGGERADGSIADESKCWTRELKHLVLAPVGKDEKTALKTYAVTRLEATTPSPPTALANAVTRLQRPEVKDCEKQHGLCRPSIRLRNDMLESGRIICGGNGATDYVAFLQLEYATPDVDNPGVRQIMLAGTTATMLFARPLDPSARTAVQVIGGDYAPSHESALGTSETAFVKLNPRCSRVIAEVPGYKAPIEKVTIASDSDPLHTGTCTATQRERTLAIEVPYTTTQERKTLTIEYKSDPPTTATASWTTVLPPVPLTLGIRSFQFAWRRPTGCSAEHWEDPDEPQPKSGAAWNASCPRATVADGSVCQLLSTSSEHCKYSCAFDPDMGIQSPPIAIHFERLRSHDAGAQPEVIYTWDDTVTFSDQTLTSTVAPSNRRVMLEFKDRTAWADVAGDALYEIRLVTPSGRGDSLLLRGRKPGQLPPRWTALAAPGACINRLQLAVFGTRAYDEKTIKVTGNRVELESAREYRSLPHLHLLLGAGLQYEDVPDYGKAYADAGLGLSLQPTGPVSYNIELTGQVTTRGYDTVARTPELATKEHVPYLRFDGRFGVEHWTWRRTHLYASIGLGFGVPLRFSDDDRVGFMFRSVPLELGLTRTLIERRLWLIGHAGLRLGEQRVRFETDFLGEPTTPRDREFQPFFGLRLRWQVS